MSHRKLGRRGFALGLAVLGLAVTGALIGVLFWGALVEAWAGRSVGRAATAAQAAEGGWVEVLAGWPALRADTIGFGWRPLPRVSLGPDAFAQPRLRRLNTRLFLIESVGEVRSGGGVVAGRTVVVLVDTDSGGATVRPLDHGPWWFALSPW